MLDLTLSSYSKQVITESDVSSVMEIIGQPTSYKVDDEDNDPNPKN